MTATIDRPPVSAPGDSRDVIIRTLKAEVAELAEALEIAGSRLAGEGWSTGTSATLRAAAARALLARLEMPV